MIIRSKILRLAEAHRRQKGLSPTAYSIAATGNEHFLRHLRDPDLFPGLRAVFALEAFILKDPAGLDLSDTILSSDIPVSPEEVRADG